MKKVLIITYYWPPAGGPGVQRVLKFAKYLPEFGWQPIILTVKNGEYPAIDLSLYPKIPNDWKIFKTKSIEPNLLYKKLTRIQPDQNIPVAVLTEKNVNWKKKIASWIRLNLFIPDAKIGWKSFAVKKGKSIIKEFRPDVIFSSSPPPTVHLIAKSLAKHNNVKWIADFRDPWTNIHYYSGLTKNILAKKIDFNLEQKVLNSANKVTVVNTGFFNKVNTNKLIHLPNGYDSADLKDTEKNYDNSKFTILYAGALKSRQYVSSFFDVLFDIAKITKYKNNLKLIVMGYVDPEVRKKIEDKKIELEVVFKGFQNHDKVLRSMDKADLLLLIIGKSDMAHQIFSTKLFEYLMVKKPILAYGPFSGAADKLLKITKAGKMYDYDDYWGTKSFILENYKYWKAKAPYSNFNLEEISKYERKRITQKLANIFEEIQ